jgi:transposase-like protein
MIECPKCHRTERQNRAGKTGSGSQRYRCMFCQIKYTPEPKPWAYPEEVRRKALQLYVDGMNLRRIARHLGLHHRTVSLWVQAQAANCPIHQYPPRSRKQRWTSCSPLSGTKKPNLRHHDRRSAYPLLSGLSSRLAENASSHPGDGG